MGDEPPSEFGAILRRLRVTAGLSQEALAERAGLSADAIAALERGRRSRPRAFTLGVLADALGLGPEDRARLAAAASGSAVSPGPPGCPTPGWLTSFIGRHSELAEVGRLLGQVRLLTLLGPGGTGKTRLALAAAERLSSAWWFAALDVCPEPELVARAVAGAVGAREVPGTPLAESLRQHVADLDGLLVLDTCEHVAAAAAEVAHELLRAAPRLRLLATSREVLRVPGEMTWQVPALPEADAVRLFADRASLAAPGFALSPDNADPVARVCRLLDGIPLAIELAAARSRALTPAQLAGRLDDAFAVLTSGLRTAAPRHQTLRATVDWSYQILEPDERRLSGCQRAAQGHRHTARVHDREVGEVGLRPVA
jgi:transcriptional regulator with XRE-family HTH domain